MGVSNSQNVLLLSVLAKAAASLSPQEINAIVEQYSGLGLSEVSLQGFLYDHPLLALAVVCGLFLLAGLGLWLTLSVRKRRREHRRVEEELAKNQLLAQAVAAAEQADLAKSRFLSQVSHEMRTPLNAIIGFMTLAQGEDCGLEEIRAYLGDAEIASKQLLSIINDVLDMSAINAGRLKLDSARFDLRQVVSAVSRIYASQCRSKGVDYDARLLSPVEETLVGDQLRLSQILNNLLSNAVKFTPPGGSVSLAISQPQSAKDRVFLRFQVKDSGCGMSEEMQERLFKPFEQESAGTARKYGGSGLGLSIVKSLVTMMGGAVEVNSRQGQGSAFTVDLPFGRCQQKAADSRIKPGPLRILVVDDLEQERNYMALVLTRIGMDFTCVEGAEAALEALERGRAEQDPYRVCLVDWRLPGMDGAALTREIRSRFRQQLSIVLVSAYERYQAGEAAREAGADLFVTKPLFQSSLFDLLISLAGDQPLIAAAAPARGDLAGRRVLVAEDNHMNRVVAVGLLKKCGVEAETAEDGWEAVEKFTTAPAGYYDAIRMDIQMPRLDGGEATRRIRQSSHPQARTVPIIALTANAFKEDIAKALSCGMTGHVAKPIEFALLTAALAQAFGLGEE